MENLETKSFYKMNETKNYFAGRPLCIATKHNKDRVISSVLNSRLGVKSFVPNNLNTDLLGTFTGEVERKGDGLTMARAKCDMAMDLTGADLSVASEGSFGPHPLHPFTYVHEEILILKDRLNKFEVSVKKVSNSTNFAGSKIENLNELIKFAKKAMFPMHGLILKVGRDVHVDMVKGIVDWPALNSNFSKLYEKYGEVYAETDMRANLNPLRMNVISQLTLDLVGKLSSKCPSCGLPGFGITGVETGLPCEECNNATNSTLAHVKECTSCGYTMQEMYPNDKQYEEPMHCDFCNP